MRIPFDIKHRDKIESGEYKVENRKGEPVRIVCYDAKFSSLYSGNQKPIISLQKEAFGEDEMICNHFPDGMVYHGEEDARDLILVTPEPEMSEFEFALRNAMSDTIALSEDREDYEVGEICDKQAKRYSAELLALAKQQLLQSGELLTQEHHEKLMETQYEECQEELRVARGKEYTQGFHNALNEKKKLIVANLTEDKITGIQHDIIEFLSNMMDARWIDIVKTADAYAERIRAEALKDLPRWKNVEADKRYVGCVTRYMDVNGDWNYCMSSGKLSDDCQYISIAALEKLPKEDQK